jgi:hypothetical protein
MECSFRAGKSLDYDPAVFTYQYTHTLIIDLYALEWMEALKVAPSHEGLKLK